MVKVVPDPEQPGTLLLGAPSLRAFSDAHLKHKIIQLLSNNHITDRDRERERKIFWFAYRVVLVRVDSNTETRQKCHHQMVDQGGNF